MERKIHPQTFQFFEPTAFLQGLSLARLAPRKLFASPRIPLILSTDPFHSNGNGQTLPAQPTIRNILMASSLGRIIRYWKLHPMCRQAFRFIPLTAVLLAVCGFPAQAELTSEEVQQAIQRARAYLIQKQNVPKGNWTAYQSQPGGVTGLCLLALLSAGDQPDEKHIAMGLEYLRNLEAPQRTYAAALQTMVYCKATPKKDRLLIRRNVGLLESWQIREGNRQGAWSYSSQIARNSGDNSNSQFALLALHEAERVGIEVSKQTWRRALSYWTKNQRPDGSWGYIEGTPGTGSMTCAGIASMVISAGRFSQDAFVTESGRVQCCGKRKKDETTEVIDRGLQWMGRNFSVNRNPVAGGPIQASRAWLLYYLYGLERVGRTTGHRFIGGHDWYREGAATLVASQNKLQGSWKGSGAMQNNPSIGTALCLLFLSKGQRPVLIAKGLRGEQEDGNQHRSDVGNLTHYVEGLWGRDMTWQLIDLETAGSTDLLQSPVLFLSGSNSLQLNEDQRRTLRAYVDQGGFLLAEACCNGTSFDHDFRQLMREIFPENPLRPLPPDHPIWFAETKVDLNHAPEQLWGIDACCRTSVVYCPEDISCYWELGMKKRDRSYPRAIEEKITALHNLGANILAYATGRELKNKLDIPQTTAMDADDSSARGILRIPKLRHTGGSDDAPSAWSNLLALVGNKRKLRTSSEKIMLPLESETLYDFPVVFMHGRRGFRWSSSEQEYLATFLERGGVLFADAICASAEFTSAFRREIQAVLPDGTWSRIPADHPLFTQEYGGYDITKVTRRDPQARSETDPLRAKLVSVSPFLEGLAVDDRYAVIFSPYDLSCALENTPSLECKGYLTEDAAKIGINVILYTLQQ